MILDEPFADREEVIAGIIELEAGSMEEALAIAAECPSLRLYPGASVEVVEAAGT